MSDKQPFTPPCPLHTAVLFLIYKRPDTTRQVFEAIRQAKPPRLYVAADGPKANVPGEAEKVQQARDIVINGVDWDCEVKTLFRETNLGCKYGVSGGITWFFEHEEEGIILEDDTLPSQSFFWFCQELLERYRDDERVMCISAQHFHGNAHKVQESYFFSRYNHCWGWASWRRAWKHYDVDMRNWLLLGDTDWLLALGEGSCLFNRYWKAHFESTYSGKIDSWAYGWTFACWSQAGLSIHPAVNMVQNIGFHADATHTNKKNTLVSQTPVYEMDFPLTHPKCIVRDVSADTWSDRHYFKINYLNELRRYVENSRSGPCILKIYQIIRNIFKCRKY